MEFQWLSEATVGVQGAVVLLHHFFSGCRVASAEKDLGCWSTAAECELRCVLRWPGRPVAPGLYQGQCGQQDQRGHSSFCLALLGLHLQSCVQVWALQFRKDIEVLEQVWGKAKKLGKDLKNQSYERWLR